MVYGNVKRMRKRNRFEDEMKEKTLKNFNMSLLGQIKNSSVPEICCGMKISRFVQITYFLLNVWFFHIQKRQRTLIECYSGLRNYSSVYVITLKTLLTPFFTIRIGNFSLTDTVTFGTCLIPCVPRVPSTKHVYLIFQERVDDFQIANRTCSISVLIIIINNWIYIEHFP